MNRRFYEIFEDYENALTKEERYNILRENGSTALKQFFKYTFDPSIKFYITEFPKDYIKPDTLPGISFSDIQSELKRMYLFIVDNPPARRLTEEKRMILLIQILETLEPKEAVLLMDMMKKELNIKNLDVNVIKEVFPNLL